MANISKNTLQSKLAHRSANRTGPVGMPHNAQDFSDLIGMKAASQQDSLRRNWSTFPPTAWPAPNAFPPGSGTPSGPEIEATTGQFALSFG
jgi:hypothetical protein